MEFVVIRTWCGEGQGFAYSTPEFVATLSNRESAIGYALSLHQDTAPYSFSAHRVVGKHSTFPALYNEKGEDETSWEPALVTYNGKQYLSYNASPELA